MISPTTDNIQGFQNGYKKGYSDGFTTATDKVTAEILALTGTSQSTAEDAVAEINTKLAKVLYTNGVDVDNADTTANLVEKVGDIPAEYACLSATTTFKVANVTAFDETTPTHYPSLYFPRIENARASFDFGGNKRVRVIGDVYVPLKHSFESTFRYCENLTRIGILNIPSVTIMSYLFLDCFTLESIGGIVGKPNSITSTFGNCKKLVRIGGELDFSNVSTSVGTFANCYALEQVAFVTGSIRAGISFGASPNLNDASRQSIKNGLADLTGQTQQTIKFHSDVLAKYTEDEILEMMSKNWLVQ